MDKHFFSLFAILACTVLVFHAGSGHAEPTLPNGTNSVLAELCKNFKAKAGADRFDEGKKLANILPQCPIIEEITNSWEILRSYDYAKPSFKLTSQQLFDLIGPPTGGENGFVDYELAHYTNGMVWTLSIQLYNDYIVDSVVFGTSSTPRSKNN